MPDQTPEEIAAAAQAAADQATADQAATAQAAADQAAAQAALDAQQVVYDASLVQLKAPDKKASITVAGVTYTPNGKGIVSVPPELVADCINVFGYSPTSD